MKNEIEEKYKNEIKKKINQNIYYLIFIYIDYK
jgi:hypothetical protein